MNRTLLLTSLLLVAAFARKTSHRDHKYQHKVSRLEGRYHGTTASSQPQSPNIEYTMEGYTSESPERESSPDSDENLEITNLESRQSSYETDTVIQPSEGPLFEAQYETNERIARISLLADRLDSYVRQARYKRFHDAYGEIQLGSITLGETELARVTDILQAPALKNNVNSIYCPTSETRKVLFVPPARMEMIAKLPHLVMTGELVKNDDPKAFCQQESVKTLLREYQGLYNSFHSSNIKYVPLGVVTSIALITAKMYIYNMDGYHEELGQLFLHDQGSPISDDDLAKEKIADWLLERQHVCDRSLRLQYKAIFALLKRVLREFSL